MLNQIMHRQRGAGRGSESLSLFLSLTKAVDLLKANRKQHTGIDRGTRISLAN